MLGDLIGEELSAQRSRCRQHYSNLPGSKMKSLMLDLTCWPNHHYVRNALLFFFFLFPPFKNKNEGEGGSTRQGEARCLAVSSSHVFSAAGAPENAPRRGLLAAHPALAVVRSSRAGWEAAHGILKSVCLSLACCPRFFFTVLFAKNHVVS